jgi:hypothetical protein
MPPYLAGREKEKTEFRRLLQQSPILDNMVLTGLRGVGKTVLLDSLKPLAFQEGWLWVGADLSESTSVSEERIVLRLCADLSVVTSNFVVARSEHQATGFQGERAVVDRTLNYEALVSIYNATPGLASDKLKKILEIAWRYAAAEGVRGIIFAYDEAQNLSDQAAKEEYPLSLLLDVFQSIQKVGLPMMLVLTGLPTLFPKLVEARTFAERMFRVIFLDRLNDAESRQAILRPIEDARCPIQLNDASVRTITDMSGGYPYFIQFVCREVYDVFIQKIDRGEVANVPVAEIQRKLDTDFFAGRWARATDRQRDLLSVIATLENADSEFTVQEVVERSKETLDKGFSSSHVNQMLATLSDQGLVFKNRYGRYSFAVPLLAGFISRQNEQLQTPER